MESLIKTITLNTLHSLKSVGNIYSLSNLAYNSLCFTYLCLKQYTNY